MGKKVAVLVPNPVNGYGLFAYLEAFFENGVEYKTFAVNSTKNVKTNSGLALELEGVIGDLKGHEAEYDGVVFACGDAIKEFAKHKEEAEYKDMFEVIAKFNELNKKLAGHCAAGLVFEIAGVIKDKKVALHPYAKAAVNSGIATDNSSMISQNVFTAKTEESAMEMIPYFIWAL